MFPSVISVNEVLSGTVTHVGNGGNNANDGTTYALRKADFSEVSIGALAVVPNGGSIVMWPGTIDDEVDFNAAAKSIAVIGTNPYNCKIASTAGTAMTLYHGCQIANIWLLGHTSGRGLLMDTKDFCRISNCIVEGQDEVGLNTQAAVLSGKNTIVDNCWFKSLAKGINMSLGTGSFISNCLIEVTKAASMADLDYIGLALAAGSTVVECTIIVDVSGATQNGKDIVAVQANGPVTLTRCNLELKGSVSGTPSSSIYSVMHNNSSAGFVILDTCTLLDGLSAIGVLDISDSSASSRTVVRGTPFNASKVSISGILNNLTDENGKVHASDVDNVGGATPEKFSGAIGTPAEGTRDHYIKRSGQRNQMYDPES